MPTIHPTITVNVTVSEFLATCTLEELEEVKQKVDRYIDYMIKHPNPIESVLSEYEQADLRQRSLDENEEDDDDWSW
jgi:hypothetical protein